MQEILEVGTRLLVIAGYSAAFVTAFLAHRNANLWSRKVASATILATTLGWILFYMYLLGLDFHSPQATVTLMLSRILHYVTATGLYISAYLIYTSERINGALDE